MIQHCEVATELEVILSLDDLSAILLEEIHGLVFEIREHLAVNVQLSVSRQEVVHAEILDNFKATRLSQQSKVILDSQFEQIDFDTCREVGMSGITPV